VVVENGYAYVGHIDPPHGTSILDVKDPKHPKVTAQVEIPHGVHRFTFDGRYAYISAHLEGYIGRIVMILDLKNPACPEEVGRWWYLIDRLDGLEILESEV